MVAPRCSSKRPALVMLLAALPVLGRAEQEPPSRPSFQGVAEMTASRIADDAVWRATNLGRVTTRGAEGGFALPVRGRLRWQPLGPVWLDSAAEVDPGRSAYALAHPRLEATWSESIAATGKLSAGWVTRHRDPVDRGSSLTLDLAVDLAILPTVTVRLEADNLLEREVSELHGVPLPGRWPSLTATLRGAP